MSGFNGIQDNSLVINGGTIVSNRDYDTNPDSGATEITSVAPTSYGKKYISTLDPSDLSSPVALALAADAKPGDTYVVID